MIKIDTLRAIGQALRRQNDSLTRAPLPAGWRDIINDMDLEEMLVEEKAARHNVIPVRGLDEEIAQALRHLKRGGSGARTERG